MGCLFKQVLQQTRHTKNKIYSLHEPETACIAKGKAHKKYEYGSKVGLTLTMKTRIITAVEVFKGSPYDGKTVAPILEKHNQLLGYQPTDLFVDRGCRGSVKIGDTSIHIPNKPKAKATEYEKLKERKGFRSRAGIEPVIGHLKYDFRMLKSYLKGLEGDRINAIMACSAWNFKKWMREIQDSPSFYQIFIVVLHLFLKFIDSQLQSEKQNLLITTGK
jgi:IS5 family transposase